MSIIFDRSLQTGDSLIDEQHQELIERANKLLESLEKGTEKRAAIETLNFLLDYTVFHFEEEEQLQAKSNYPNLETHKAQHQGFIQSVHELVEMLEEEEGPTDAFVAAVNRNVTEWLINHIQIQDKAVASYLQAHA